MRLETVFIITFVFFSVLLCSSDGAPTEKIVRTATQTCGTCSKSLSIREALRCHVCEFYKHRRCEKVDANASPPQYVCKKCIRAQKTIIVGQHCDQGTGTGTDGEKVEDNGGTLPQTCATCSKIVSIKQALRCHICKFYKHRRCEKVGALLFFPKYVCKKCTRGQKTTARASSSDSCISEHKEGNVPSHRIHYKPGRTSGDLYTEEEERFIINELESVGTAYTSSTWSKIAQAHENKRKSNCFGFNRVRTPRSIKQHFFCCTMQKTRFGGVTVPESVKKIFAKPRIKFSQEEDDFINEELSDHTVTRVFDNDVWKNMEEKHRHKRISGAPGFAVERSAHTLRSHFNGFMRRKGLLTDAVNMKLEPCFPQINRSAGSSSEGSPNTSTTVQSCISQDTGEEGDREDWVCMIDELINAPITDCP